MDKKKDKLFKALDIKFEDITSSGEEKGHFKAYLSKFGIIDRANEYTVRGCCDNSIRKNNGKFVALYNHDHSEPIGFFNLVDDGIGLLMDGQFNLSEDVPLGRKSYALALQAKEMDMPFGFSIGYIAVKSEWDSNRKATAITEIDLYEGSFAPIPCLPDALLIDVKNTEKSNTNENAINNDTDVKSTEEELDFNNVRHFEKHLRDVCGFSTKKAKRVASLAKTYRDDGLTEEEFGIEEESKKAESEKLEKLQSLLGLKKEKAED